MAIKIKRAQTDFLTHPGEELADVLASVGMTQKTLALRTGLSRKHINRIVRGKERISTKVALLLENVLGTPASFWINLTRNYEFDLARNEANTEMADHVPQLKRFPISEMIAHGWIKDVNSKVEQVRQLLSFLGVASFDIFNKVLQQRFAAAYRKTKHEHASKESLAVWIRAGQLQANRMKLPKFNEDRLRSALPELRRLTQDVNAFSNDAAPLLASCGVAMVLAPHLKGTYANGATYWVEDGAKPVVQLSLRHKWCDIIYFTLFHEIGHVLKHPRSQMFIEDNVVDKQENEANAFAGETLIPSAAYDAFLRANQRITVAAVKAFAKSLQIHPCIVVGRLQKEERLPYSAIEFRQLKPQFEWSEA